MLTAADGASVEIIDFAPRHPKHSRTYRPLAFGRIVRPLEGSPRIRVRLRPSADWGARRAETTNGSNHIRYLCTDVTFRLTTDCPVSHMLNERTFRLEKPHAFFFGPDEGYDQDVVPGRLGRARPHRRLLAGLGAHPLPAAGLSGGGDPRGDHPQALRLRGDGRDVAVNVEHQPRSRASAPTPARSSMMPALVVPEVHTTAATPVVSAGTAPCTVSGVSR